MENLPTHWDGWKIFFTCWGIIKLCYYRFKISFDHNHLWGCKQIRIKTLSTKPDYELFISFQLFISFYYYYWEKEILLLFMYVLFYELLNSYSLYRLWSTKLKVQLRILRKSLITIKVVLIFIGMFLNQTPYFSKNKRMFNYYWFYVRVHFELL